MQALQAFKSAERSFFEFFGMDVPSHQYMVYDYTDYHWAAEEKGHAIWFWANSPDPNNKHIDIDYMNRYRKDKGQLYEKDGYTMFRITFSIKENDFSYFKVFSDDLFKGTYDDLKRFVSSKS